MRTPIRSSPLFSSSLALPLSRSSRAPRRPARQARPAEPNPALTEAFKDMAGTWAAADRWTTRSHRDPGEDQERDAITPAVDGFAYTGVFKMEKNAAMPRR